MIGGIIMVLVALWVFQSASRAKVNNVLFWVAACSVLFLAVQVLFVNLNIWIIDGMKGVEINPDYDRELTSIGDRKTGGSQSIGGMLLSVLFEVLPPLAGIISVGLVKTKLMLKAPLTVANIFSGWKELFIGIKNSFKTSE
nr:hypothetical protein [Methylicorpusculum oleiharenae]